MSSKSHEVELQFCRLICTGKVDEAGALLNTHHDLLRHSVHCAAAWGDADFVASHLAQDASCANALLGEVWSPLLVLSLSHCSRPSSPRAAGTLRSARLLLAHDASVGASLPDDELPAGHITLLAAAAGITANLDLCRVLLDAGAVPNDGAALFIAAAEQHWDCVSEIVARGGDINATDAGGRFAPLHWILGRRYRRPALDRILSEGADPNVRGGALQETALHVAARRRRLEALDPLHRAGADLNARTTGGMTAYRHARRRNFADIADKLAEMGADCTTSSADALAVALLEGRIEEARALLGENPRLVPSGIPEEVRLVADLAGAGKADALALLLDNGVDITARGLDAGTPLHQAAWFGQPEVAQLLVERGAPLTIRGDDHDCTPLGWVAHGSRFSGGAAQRSNVYVELAEALLEAGAPFPQPGEHHDREQFASASDAVAAVLQRFGWNPDRNLR